MKFKTRLIIHHFLLICFLLSVYLFWYFADMQTVSDRFTEVALQSVQDVVDSNYSLSKEILIEYGKETIMLKSESVVLKLAEELKKIDISDYDAIRKNSEIRKHATQDILTIDGLPVGYFDLYDKTGLSLLHPNPQIEGHNYSEWGNQFPEMWKLVQKSFLENKVSGFYKFIDKNGMPARKFMFLVQVPDTPFILAAVVTTEEYYEFIHKKITDIGEKAKNKADKRIDEEEEKIKVFSFVWGLVTTVFLFLTGILFAYSFSNRITKPLEKFCSAVSQLGNGNFEVKVDVPEKSPAELKSLSDNFNRLGEQLRHNIEKLKAEISAREAMQGEINAARTIQNTMLPDNTANFAEIKEFELKAKLIPAKEVSGDFYDYFKVSEDEIAILIADVSGKGIPAALFMAVTRTLIRKICSETIEPAKALQLANSYLASGNDSCMFVTLFLAFYNYKTGMIRYSNAGHNSGIIVNPEGKLEEFGLQKCCPLGINPEAVFLQETKLLPQGYLLFLYTDGVTEAVSPELDFFGEKRLFDMLLKYGTISPEELCSLIIHELEEFQKNNQSDDITIVAMKRR